MTMSSEFSRTKNDEGEYFIITVNTPVQYREAAEWIDHRYKESVPSDFPFVIGAIYRHDVSGPVLVHCDPETIRELDYVTAYDEPVWLTFEEFMRTVVNWEQTPMEQNALYKKLGMKFGE